MRKLHHLIQSKSISDSLSTLNRCKEILLKMINMGQCQSCGDTALYYNTGTTYGAHYNELFDVREAHKEDSNEAFEQFFPSYVKYPNLSKMLSMITEKHRMEELFKSLDKPLRKWQQDLVNELQNEPNERTVIWIVDEAGNKGKT